MMVLAVVLSSLYFVACCLLIHGARVGKATFLTPWIVIKVVVLVLNLLETIRWFSTNCMNMGLVLLLPLLLGSYFLICIQSLQEKIEEDKIKPRKNLGIKV